MHGSDRESRDAGNDVIYYDDISGAPLKTELVEDAIQEEMDQYRSHEVCTKVPIAQRYERTGKKPVGVRWVIVNKGDDDNSNVRARLVAKEIKSDSRLDMFAATPPLEAKKFLLPRAATSGWLGANKGHRKSIFIDIKRAYMYAPEVREIYVELPPKDAEPECMASSTSPCTERVEPHSRGKNTTATSTSMCLVSSRARPAHVASTTNRETCELWCAEAASRHSERTKTVNGW